MGVESCRRCGTAECSESRVLVQRDDPAAALPKGPVTESTIQDKLCELRQQFSTLQQLSRLDPGQCAELLPVVLSGMGQSIEELQDGANAPTTRAGDEAASKAGPRLERAARFRSMAEHSEILVRIMGRGTRCRWANHAWHEGTGRQLRQLLGEGWLEFVHADDRERCARACREAFETNRLYRLEYRLRAKSGAYRWILEIGTPRINVRGAVGGYLSIATDVTDQKRAETYLTLQYLIARDLVQAKSIEEASAQALQHLCHRLGWDLGELWALDASGEKLRCKRLWSSHDLKTSVLDESAPTREFPSSGGASWQSGAQVWIADIALDAALAAEPECARLGMHGMLRLPIRVHGSVQAVLRLFTREARQHDDREAEFLRSVCVQIGQFLERKLGAEQMVQSEARKAAILEASLDAVITIDEEGGVVELNSAAELLFGCRRSDALGSPFLVLIIPPRLREQALARFAAYRKSEPDVLLGKRFESRAMRVGGEEFPVEVVISAITTGGKQLLTIFVRDVSARRDAESAVTNYQQRLRTLMADLLMAEERERRRLAVDLHDGLSQTIALAQMKLAALGKSMGGKLGGAFEEIEGLLVETNRTARAIGFELSPPVLHDFGLEPALQWLVENIQSRYGIEIVLETDAAEKPADERTRVILFRSIRELLINAAKHAGARHVRVSLKREADRLDALVEDDGQGMAQEAEPSPGTGLLSIRERMSHVGGSMRVDSTPGKGTRIRLTAPIGSTVPMSKGRAT